MNLSELAQHLAEIGVNPDAYSLGTGVPEADESYCLVYEDEMWRIYYAERGKRGDMREYVREEDACDAFIKLLKRDESVWKQ